MIASPTVYEINPRRFRKAGGYMGCLIAFWILWFPLTCAVTWMLFNGGPVVFLIIWLTIAWAGVILIPISVIQRNRKQVLTAAGDRLLITGIKPFSLRATELHRDELAALTLERYGNANAESVYTLNLLQKPGHWPGRYMLAPFVHPDGKAVLFGEIASFLESNGFRLEFRNEMVT